MGEPPLPPRQTLLQLFALQPVAWCIMVCLRYKMVAVGYSRCDSVSLHTTIGGQTSCRDALRADPDALGLHCYDDTWAALRAGPR